MAVSDIKRSHDLADIFIPVLSVPSDGEGHGDPDVVTLHSLVIFQIIDLQNPQGLGIDQEGQVFDEVGTPLIRGEIDDDHLFLFVPFGKRRDIPNDPKHPFLFFSIFSQPFLNKFEMGYLFDRTISKLLDQVSHVTRLIVGRLKRGL
jgi:hypothetical protein